MRGMLHNMISPTGRPWLDELASATEQFRAVIASAENHDALSTPVAACPGWDLQELAIHVGRTHLWATQILAGADPRDRPQDTPKGPLAPWYAGIAENLRHALAEAGPHAPCWTLVKEQRTALFWQRRQVHETLVHLWDARSALSQQTEFDKALAFDGIAEIRDVMYPRMLRAGRVDPLPVSLAISATDLEAELVVIGEAPEEAVLEGPAAELLLLLWHRLPWDDTYGDQRAADLVAQALVP